MKIGDEIIILEGFRDIPRRCKIWLIRPNGIVIGETANGLRFSAHRPDRYIIPDLFHPVRYDPI